MSKLNEFELLCNELVDGDLSDAGHVSLYTMMSNNKDLRRWYRHFMAMHASLQWDYSALANQQSSSAHVASVKIPQRNYWLPMAAAAVLMFALSIGIMWQLMSPAHLNDITVVDVSDGTALWTSGSVQQRSLTSGDTVKTGSLSLSGVGAKATLRFADQTTLSITGDTVLSVIDDGQKRLHVQHGLLIANVVPQPPGHPLEIKTDTAAIQVVGTSFSIMVQPDATALEVDEGRVQMLRLVDGQRIEVTTKQVAVATLNTTNEFIPKQRQQLPTRWQYDGNTPLVPPSKGTWQAAKGSDPGFVHAEPYVAGHRDDQSLVIHHGVRFHNLDGSRQPFVTLTKNSVIRMKYRFGQKGNHAMKFFINTSTDKGGFGGNFETTIQTDSAKDAHGWQTAIISVADIESITPEHPTPIGRNVGMLLPFCFSAAADLQVSEIEVYEASPTK